MSESEKYKQFAADCLRIAETLTWRGQEKTIENRRRVDGASAGSRNDRA